MRVTDSACALKKVLPLGALIVSKEIPRTVRRDALMRKLHGARP
jgi:hypothetical protein